MATKKCGCGKCAACRRNKSSWVESKADKKMHKKLEKGMTPAQKKKFEAENKKMDAKNPSKKEDIKMDRALAAKIKKCTTGKCGKCHSCKPKKTGKK
jgi:hypothetical protein